MSFLEGQNPTDPRRWASTWKPRRRVVRPSTKQLGVGQRHSSWPAPRRGNRTRGCRAATTKLPSRVWPSRPTTVQALHTGRGKRLIGSSLQGCHHVDGECAKTRQRSPTEPFKSSKASTKSRVGQKRQCAPTRRKKSLWEPQIHVSLEAGGGQKKDPSAASRESFRGSVASGLVAPVSADPDGTRISVGVSPTSVRSDTFRPETCLWRNQPHEQATSPDSLCRHPVAKLATSHWQTATERRIAPTVSVSQTKHLKAPSCQALNPATVRRRATQLMAIWSFTPFRLKSVRKTFGPCVEVFPDARGTLRRAAAHYARRLQHVRCTASTCHASDGSSHCWACLPG